MPYDKIINILPLFFIEMAALVSLLSFRERFPVNMRWLSLIWVGVFLVEVTGHVTGLFGIRNFWLYNCFDIFFVIGIALVYRQELKSPVLKKTIVVFLAFFAVFALINIIFLQQLRNYNSLNYISGGAFLILLAGAFFWQLYASDDTRRISREPFFWFSAGFLIYFGGSVPFLGMYNLLIDKYPDFAALYQKYVYVFFSILLNICIVTGYLCRKEFPKTY